MMRIANTIQNSTEKLYSALKNKSVVKLGPDVVDGEVSFRGVAHPHFSARILKRRLLRWACQMEAKKKKIDDDVYYNVSFGKEPKGKVNCHLEVRLGPEIWLGEATCPNAQRAFLKSLRSASPVFKIQPA